MDSANAIGVFDSGVGGLSILSEIREQLPNENLIYVADSGNAPYGDKSERWIEERATRLVDFLVACDAKAVVVACNTVTTVAINKLRATFSIPIIAIEPAVKPAIARTKSGTIAVLATTRTLSSRHFLELQDRFRADARIVLQPCPGLVGLVEAGDLDSVKARTLISSYVQPLLHMDVDTLVLGCTHYSFLAPLIQEVAGPDVAVIDPAAAVARETRRRLHAAGLLSHATSAGRVEIVTTAPIGDAQPVIADLWAHDAVLAPLPEIYNGYLPSEAS